jgi:hypothetical protein
MDFVIKDGCSLALSLRAAAEMRELSEVSARHLFDSLFKENLLEFVYKQAWEPFIPRSIDMECAEG